MQSNLVSDIKCVLIDLEKSRMIQYLKKMGKYKFTVIDQATLSDSDGNSGPLARSLDMYEVSTAKILKGDEVSDEVNRPEIFCACRNNWFAVAIDSDIHIFDVTVGCIEFSPDSSKGRIESKSKDKRIFAIPDGARVIGLRFIPSSDIIVVLISNGTVFFANPTNRLHYQCKCLPPIENCAMDIVTTEEEHCVAITDRKGAIHLLTIPKFDSSIQDDEEFDRIFSSIQKYQIVQNGIVYFIANVSNAFVFFPKKKGEIVRATSIRSTEFSKPSNIFTLNEDVLVVRTVGFFIAILKTNGCLTILDQNLVEVHSMVLFKESECTVLDFEFLDIPGHSEFPENAKVLLKVKSPQQEIEFKIKQINEADAQFSTQCSEHTILVPLSTPGDENNIIYIDAFPSKNPHDVLVRFVGEAQPILRLKKLIRSKRFNEAEEFAKSYNLPLDMVYTELVSHYQEQIQNAENGLYEEESFLEMMRSMGMLNDNNMAGDHCVAVLNFVNQYRHIKAILEFAKGLNITDEYTQNELDRFRYELATYRMVFEAEGARYDRESSWPLFLASTNHTELFDRFCEAGKIVEARILFARYVEISQYLYEEMVVTKLLAVFKAVITENPTLCEPTSEFLEADLIPIFLYSDVNNIKNVCSTLADFFIDVSLLLEQIEPRNFPQKSLNFAETFNRAVGQLRQSIRTSDQHVGFLHILKQLDSNGQDTAVMGRLNDLIHCLKKLSTIHTVYQCAMSYSEYMTHDINSICYRIMDKVRSASSVREHIEQFVFPYIEENGLNRNEMLHAYIKQLANSYYSGTVSQPNNTWDLLCLKITEQITDINMRCRALIEVASGTVPPWSQQLTNVIKSVIAQGEKVDPELIKLLRMQCQFADLGQIFIKYQIPLNSRSRVIGGAGLKSLLQFMFKNSNNEMGVKLQDAFNVVEIYENLQSKPIFTKVDCYFFYAVVIIQQFTDESEIKPLTDLFQLIKSSSETETVAWKLVSYFKCLLKPNKIKNVVSHRLVWISCMLCVLERYLPSDSTIKKLICDSRALRKLQMEYEIVLGFESLREKKQSISHLITYIEAPNEKSIVETVNFGSLLGLDMKEIYQAIISVQIKNGMTDTALNTLDYMASNVPKPTMEHLVIALDTCTYVCWKFTESVKDDSSINYTKIEFARIIVRSFKSVLAKLIEWSVSLGALQYAESFMRISRYVALFNLVLGQCTQFDEEIPKSSDSNTAAEIASEQAKGDDKFYATKPRIGILLPHQEGTMYDSASIVKAISVVASSVVEPPVEVQHRDEFNEQMCESWDRVFVLLSGSHVFLEIQARRFAHTLACFNSHSNLALIAIDRNIIELCKKIFNFPIADLLLASHLLTALSIDGMKKILQELRRWVQSKKNVRFTLNLISVSLFVLIVTSQEANMIKQVATWLETTQWQKRLLKQGINMGNTMLRRDNIYELIGEFAKVLLPPSFLKEYCEEAHCSTSAILLNYFIELCKLSSHLTDASRFELCIEIAKAAIQDVHSDEKAFMVLMVTLKDISPYNYETIELLLKKLNEVILSDNVTSDNPDFARVKDACILLRFLRCTKRGKDVIPGEVRWYKHFTNQRNYDASFSSVHTELISPDESVGAHLVNESTLRPHQQQQSAQQLFQTGDSEFNLPQAAHNRLPFHLLSNDESDSDKFQTKLIYHELTIFNVQHWITLVEETTTILQQSRSYLLVGAITNHVNEAVKYKRELCSDDLVQIKTLISDSHSRLSILKALASRFQRLHLSQTKISLIQLCYEVIQRWILSFDELKIPPKERDTYQSYFTALGESLVVIKTELLLDSFRVLNPDTKSLTQRPKELVNRLLCSNKIEWEENESVSLCFDVIDGISKIHSVDLEEVFLELIDCWIPGGQDQSDQAIAQMSSDPDSTIDFGGSPSVFPNSGSNEESEFIMPVLYDDTLTTRIIVLLKKIKDPMSKVVEMSRKYEVDVSILPGGYITKVRIASCILRFLTADQMKDTFKITVNQFCGNLVDMLNQRLYSMCRIDVPTKDLQIMEKRVDFVRSILSPQSAYRQTPEIAHLLVCLIVDNDIEDLTILGKAAQRLIQLRLSKPLMELLKHLRGIREKDVKSIPNFPTYYAKTFEAFFDKLDFPTARKELLSLIFFLISCPIEGEGYFTRAVSLLNNIGACCASAVVSISANATSDVNLMNEWKMPDLDLNLCRAPNK